MALANELTEHKKINVVNKCINEPVYLSWLNDSSGASYYLFGKLNIDTISTKEVGYYERYVEDLTTAQGNDSILSKTVEKTTTVGALVNLQDMDGLSGLFKSPKVKILTNPLTWETDGPKWNDVRVQTGSLVIKETNKSLYEVEFTLILPKQYVISE